MKVLENSQKVEIKHWGWEMVKELNWKKVEEALGAEKAKEYLESLLKAPMDFQVNEVIRTLYP